MNNGLIKVHTKNRSFGIYQFKRAQPNILGKTLIREIIYLLDKYGIERLCRLLDNLYVINDRRQKPSFNDIHKLQAFCNLYKHSGKYDDWLCLLDKCQGSLSETIKSGYVLNAVDEPNSPYIAYVYNLDLSKNIISISQFNTELNKRVNLFHENIKNIISNKYDDFIFD